METLISEYQIHAALLDALDAAEDFEAWAKAADDMTPFFTNLVNEVPTTLQDFAAKFAALIEVTEED